MRWDSEPEQTSGWALAARAAIVLFVLCLLIFAMSGGLHY